MSRVIFLRDDLMSDDVEVIWQQVHLPHLKVCFLGDLNIDWLLSCSPLKNKLQAVTSVCNLVQVISQPTRVFTNRTGTKWSSCTDHIFMTSVCQSLRHQSVTYVCCCWTPKPELKTSVCVFIYFYFILNSAALLG
jgi:hypothetical protein